MKADIIAVDIGTSSCKAVLFSDTGEIMAAGKGSYPLILKDHDQVEQDPELIFHQVLNAIRQIEDQTEDMHTLQCISFCAQMSAQFLVDKEGKPLTNLISWMDRRAEMETRQLNQDFDRKKLEELTGLDMVVTPAYGIPKLMWLKKHAAELLSESALFVQIKDYVIFRLTGHWVSDETSLKGFVNQKNGEPVREIFNYMGITETLLPEVRRPYEKAGVITKHFPELYKIPEGTPVAVGWNDMNAAFLGMGALLENGIGLDMTGTSEHFGWSGYMEETENVDYTGNNCVPYLNGRKIIYGVSSSSGLAVEWYVKEYLGEPDVAGYAERMLARGRKKRAEMPLFLPYLEGERSPWNNPRARGVFFGLGRESRQEDLMEAVLEGICFELKAIEEHLPYRPKRIIVSGGASENRVWNQMKADIFESVVQTVNVREAGCTGAAFLALKALDQRLSLQEISEKRIRIKEEYHPKTEDTTFYKERYQTFLRLYQTLENEFWKEKEGKL